MQNPESIAAQYIALWNETDAAKRSAMLEKEWTCDAMYIDPLMLGHGHAEINSLIGAVQERFPEFCFTLLGGANGHGDYARFSWLLGPPGGEAPIGGSDMVELSGGRLRKVVGFLDRVPAA